VFTFEFSFIKQAAQNLILKTYRLKTPSGL
jgi:hypothetical protein